MQREPSHLHTHLVSQRQLVFTEPHAPTQALGDTEPVVVKLSRELEADAAQTRVALGVDAEARRQLADDGPKVARLEPTRGRQRAVYAW